MAKEHRYAINLRWTGAAQGPTSAYRDFSRAYEYRAGNKPLLAGSADPAFLGDAAAYNPEEALVAALSACHMLTYLANCALAGVKVLAYEDRAEGVMTQQGRGGRFTEVVLHPRVTISADSDAARAEQLHEPAHRDCFIARSVNFPVRHEAEIVTGS
ncbi:MAG: OsmC family protein [Alphaproteobacteria bacterium]